MAKSPNEIKEAQKRAAAIDAVVDMDQGADFEPLAGPLTEAQCRKLYEREAAHRAAGGTKPADPSDGV